MADGVTGASVDVDTRLLPGAPTARLRVIATDGVNSADAEGERTFVIDDKPPLVGILSPVEAVEEPASAAVELIGAGYDPEDGLLSGRQLRWTSDRDGLLGHGARISTRGLSAGSHRITLIGCDNSSHCKTATVDFKSAGRASTAGVTPSKIVSH